MKKEIPAPKKFAQPSQQSSSHFSFMKKKTIFTTSAASSSSSSLFSNAENRQSKPASIFLKANKSKNGKCPVKMTCNNLQLVPACNSGSKIILQNESVVKENRPPLKTFMPPCKRQDDTNLEVTRPSDGINNYDAGLFTNDETPRASIAESDNHYETLNDVCDNSSQQSDADSGKNKFTSPWVLSTEVANKPQPPIKRPMQSKLPVKPYLPKLARSRTILAKSGLTKSQSNLSRSKSALARLKPNLSRTKSIYKSNTRLHGSRRNLVPPAPPVRTVSLKTGQTPQTGGPNRNLKTKQSQTNTAMAQRTKPTIPNGIQMSHPLPPKPDDLTLSPLADVAGVRMSKKISSDHDKRFSNANNNFPRTSKHPQGPVVKKLEKPPSKGHRYSEEIEASLHFLNSEAIQLKDNATKQEQSQTKSSKNQNFNGADYSYTAQRPVHLSHEPQKQSMKMRANSLQETIKDFQLNKDFEFLSSNRKLGSKLNYVMKKTGMAERHESKNKISSDYATLEYMKTLKSEYPISSPQPHHLKSSFNDVSNSQLKPLKFNRLNSEPADSRRSPSALSGSVANQPIDQCAPPFVRSRLGSVPTLPSSYAMYHSTVSDKTMTNTLPKAPGSSQLPRRQSSCKRSMSDVGNSYTMMRSLGKEKYNSLSRVANLHSPFLSFSPSFHSLKRETSDTDLLQPRGRTNSESFNQRTLNPLHLISFQEPLYSDHKKYYHSQTSISSKRSLPVSSNYAVPLGRSTIEVQNLQKELEHAQSRINNLTSQLSSNVQVVASFEQNLEKMMSRLHKMSVSAGLKDSEISDLRSLIHRMDDHGSTDADELSCRRISKSCEDLLECNSKKDDATRSYKNLKKERKRNWLVSSISKAFLKNKVKPGMESDMNVLMQHIKTECQQSNNCCSSNNIESLKVTNKIKCTIDVFEGDEAKEKNIYQSPTSRRAHNICKVKRNVEETYRSHDHNESLMLNIKTIPAKTEITVKQFTKKLQNYNLFVVFKEETATHEHNNPKKVLAGNIEITNKSTWSELDKKIQTCFEEHLKKLDSDCLNLSSESILNYNIGGLWRRIGDPNPEFLPCGYLVGDHVSINIYLKGFNEKSFDAWSYETLYPSNVLRKCSHLFIDHKQLIIIGRPEIDDSNFLKRVVHYSINMPKLGSNSMLVLNLKTQSLGEAMKSTELFVERLKSKTIMNETKLLILKNCGNLSHVEGLMSSQQISNLPNLYVIGEVEEVPGFNKNFKHKFNLWMWPEESIKYCKRYLTRTFIINKQVSYQSKNECADVLLQWLHHFMDKLNTLAIPDSKKDFKKLTALPADGSSAQVWFNDLWLCSIQPQYSHIVDHGSWSSLVKWVEQTWPWKIK